MRRLTENDGPWAVITGRQERHLHLACVIHLTLTHNTLKPSVPKRSDVRTAAYTAVSTPRKEQSHLANGSRHGVRR